MTGLILLSTMASIYSLSAPDWCDFSDDISMDICVFDANGDEYLDILFPVYSDDALGELRLYISNSGSFASSPDWVSSHKAAFQTVCVGDVDNDGDLDIAAGTVRAGQMEGYNCVFLNNGPGAEIPFQYNPSWQSEDNLDTIHMQLADIDQDGWLELVAANYLHRIMVYDNVSGQLTTSANDFFVEKTQTTFDITQAGYGSDPDYLDIVCAFIKPFGELSVLANTVYSFSGAIDPYSYVWQDTEDKPMFSFRYRFADLDFDGLIDFVSTASHENFQVNLCQANTPLNFTQILISGDMIQLNNGENLDIKALCTIYPVDVAPEASNQSCELYLCNRGMRELDDQNEHIMYMSEDVLIEVGDWSNPIPITSWISPIKQPTTEVDFADLNRDGIVLNQMQFTPSSPNQTFKMPAPIERVICVSANNVLLTNNQYHIDRSQGLLSLIGDFSEQTVLIDYETSTMLDVVCASTHWNHYFLNQN